MQIMNFPGGSVVKSSPLSAGDVGSIPGSGRSPGEGNGNPLWYSGVSHGQRSLAGYSPWDHKKVRLNLETKQQQPWELLLWEYKVCVCITALLHAVQTPPPRVGFANVITNDIITEWDAVDESLSTQHSDVVWAREDAPCGWAAVFIVKQALDCQ